VVSKFLGKVQHIATVLKSGQIANQSVVQSQSEHIDFIHAAVTHSSSPSKPCHGSSDRLFLASSFVEPGELSVGVAGSDSSTAITAPSFSVGMSMSSLFRPFAISSNVSSRGFPLDSRRWYC